jgi:hypothetical protein
MPETDTFDPKEDCYCTQNQIYERPLQSEGCAKMREEMQKNAKEMQRNAKEDEELQRNAKCGKVALIMRIVVGKRKWNVESKE